MSEFLKLTVNIFILIIIASVIENFISESKTATVIKSAISIMILLTVVTYISALDISSQEDFLPSEYSIDTESVWQAAKDNSEKVLMESIYDVCTDNGLSVYDVKVNVDTDFESFNINSVEISGVDRYAARTLIAAHYGIPQEKIYIGGG